MPDTGIYTIVHRPTQAVYVGQARDIDARWSAHRRDLERGVGGHVNDALSRLWQQSGPGAFEWSIVQSLPGATKAALDEAEQRWMAAVEGSGQALLNERRVVTRAALDAARTGGAMGLPVPSRPVRPDAIEIPAGRGSVSYQQDSPYAALARGAALAVLLFLAAAGLLAALALTPAGGRLLDWLSSLAGPAWAGASILLVGVPVATLARLSAPALATGAEVAARRGLVAPDAATRLYPVHRADLAAVAIGLAEADGRSRVEGARRPPAVHTDSRSWTNTAETRDRDRDRDRDAEAPAEPPARVELADWIDRLGDPARLEITIGVGADGRPVSVPLTGGRARNIALIGGTRGGKTTMAVSIVRQLERHAARLGPGSVRVVVLDPQHRMREAVERSPIVERVYHRDDIPAVVEWLPRLIAGRAERRAAGARLGALFVIIDEANVVFDTLDRRGQAALIEVARACLGERVYLVSTMQDVYSRDQMRQLRNLLGLRVVFGVPSEAAAAAFGVSDPAIAKAISGRQLPAGRAAFVGDDGPVLVQTPYTPTPSPAETIEAGDWGAVAGDELPGDSRGESRPGPSAPAVRHLSIVRPPSADRPARTADGDGTDGRSGDAAGADEEAAIRRLLADGESPQAIARALTGGLIDGRPYRRIRDRALALAGLSRAGD